MKKTIRNLFAILMSGVMLAGAVLGVPSGLFDFSSDSYTIQEQTKTMSSSKEQIRTISVHDINEKQVFADLLKKNGGKKESGSESGKTSTEVTHDDKTTATASGVTSDTTASSTSTSTSSRTESSTKATTTTTVKIPEDESKNIEYIKDPDYKSPYYIVVYTGSQSTVVYGKDQSGNYSRLIKSFTVSTGRKNSTPTRKGLYKIRAKYRWRTLMGPCYGQYCSSISPDYLFHSVPYGI